MVKIKKKKTRQDLAFPIDRIPSLTHPIRPPENPVIMKQIIRGAIQGAYCKKQPSEPSPYGYNYEKKQQPLVTEEQVQFVTHLIESLEPSNAIEAALASQFAITYIRGLEMSQDSHSKAITITLDLFEFSQQVLEALQRYRTKGAQLISVNYNHNQGQINNIKVIETHERSAATIDVKNTLQ